LGESRGDGFGIELDVEGAPDEESQERDAEGENGPLKEEQLEE